MSAANAAQRKARNRAIVAFDVTRSLCQERRMPTAAGLLVAIALAVTAGGCQGAMSGDRPNVTAGLPAESWTLREDLRIGSASDTAPAPDQFGTIASIVADSAGTIYVLDLLSQNIQVFDSAGAYVRTIGRKGRGPGELLAARGMMLGPGGTLWVVDDGMRRYSSFALDGRFLESRSRNIAGFGSAGATFLRDGSLVDWGMSFPDGRFGAHVLYYPIRYKFGAAQGSVDAAAAADTLPALRQSFKMLPSRRMPETLFGDRLVTVIDQSGDVWFAHSREYRIFRRSSGGDTTLVFQRSVMPAHISAADRAYVRRSLAGMGTLLSEYLDNLPATKPIVRRLLIDRHGHVFVLAQLAGGMVFDVLARDGSYLASMKIPVQCDIVPGQAPIAYATRSHLYTVVKDSTGAQYVSRLRIVQDSTR